MTLLKDLRSYRVFNLALFDMALTFASIIIVHSLLWHYPLDIEDKERRTWAQYFASFTLITITFFGVGLIVHRLIGVRSAFSAYMGMNKPPKNI